MTSLPLHLFNNYYCCVYAIQQEYLPLQLQLPKVKLQLTGMHHIYVIFFNVWLYWVLKYCLYIAVRQIMLYTKSICESSRNVTQHGTPFFFYASPIITKLNMLYIYLSTPFYYHSWEHHVALNQPLTFSPITT